MADKFNTRTKQWDAHPPELTLPPAMKFEAIAWEEFNGEVRKYREIVELGRRALVGLPESFDIDATAIASLTAGEPVFVVKSDS